MTPATEADEISNIAFGFMGSKALFLAIDLDLFSKLAEGPKTADEVAEATDVHRDRVETLMTALAGLGLLTVEDGKFANSPAAESFLVKGAKYDFGDYLRLQVGKQMYGLLDQIEDVLTAIARPSHAAALQPRLHDVLGRGFNGAASDRQPSREELRVTHAITMEAEVVDGVLDDVSLLRAVVGQRPSVSAHRADGVVDAALVDFATFSSARGAVLEIIQSGMDIPPGTLIFEDPPIHNIHRKLLSRIFTPRKVSALEPKIREFTARCLDPLIGTGGFDFVKDLGAQMPMRVIGMLLGIPEADQQHVVEHGDSTLRTERGGKMTENPDGAIATGEVFAEYIDWRAKHPSDDIMTELLTAEFADETGVIRRLGRDELLLYLQVIATAGSETTTRLLGWAGKVLAEHPDQRHTLVTNRTLLPSAIEELLRFEPPAPHVSRYVTCDVEYYGRSVPAGSAMMLTASTIPSSRVCSGLANRFERHNSSSAKPR